MSSLDLKRSIPKCISAVKTVAEDVYADDQPTAEIMLGLLKDLERYVDEYGTQSTTVCEQIDLITNFRVRDDRLIYARTILFWFKKNKPIIRGFKACASLMLALNM